MPARIVTFLVELSREAAAFRLAAEGSTAPAGPLMPSSIAGEEQCFVKMSPGTTTTATHRFASAVRMAIASTRGICSGDVIASQKSEQVRKRCSGLVDWK